MSLPYGRATAVHSGKGKRCHKATHGIITGSLSNANVYDEIGGHYRTRGEIVEDGRLLKIQNAHSLMKNVTAVWARDRRTLWNAIKRLMVASV